MPVKVLNRKYDGVPDGAVYVGRPTKWGNPFVMGRDGNRAAVIVKYVDYLMTKPDLIEAARKELAGKDLVCWCAPQACHAEVLAMIANWPS